MEILPKYAIQHSIAQLLLIFTLHFVNIKQPNPKYISVAVEWKYKTSDRFAVKIGEPKKITNDLSILPYLVNIKFWTFA